MALNQNLTPEQIRDVKIKFDSYMEIKARKVREVKIKE